MDVEPHKSERAGTKGTLMCSEKLYCFEGKGSFDVQLLSIIKTKDAHRKER